MASLGNLRALAESLSINEAESNRTSENHYRNGEKLAEWIKIEGEEPFDKNNEGKASNAGCITMIVAIVIAISPLFFAAGSGSSNMWSEGPGGGGGAIWAMFATVPLGILIFIIGAIVQGVASSRARKDRR